MDPKKDILEVQNAMEVYKNLAKYNPLFINDLLKAHRTLMQQLTELAGFWRSGNVGIFKEQEITHLPPSAKRVPILMNDLFQFLVADSVTPWLIKACVFHYELEFIHPLYRREWSHGAPMATSPFNKRRPNF